ncbi:heparinase II/III family protein [Occultella aeris]|uniref:Heparinase II/III-like protein n=1 Tax=Occultella aeris TaxID=2761496 RepID=A0A7M4DRJ8_9MICO|nr:heparinase II/III family protein [Occultella aeris]VZO40092.1 Heparinase II/III-like protein [Occultella aeris]
MAKHLLFGSSYSRRTALKVVAATSAAVVAGPPALAQASSHGAGPQYLRDSHPRLLAKPSDFDAVASRVVADEVSQGWFSTLEELGTELLAAPTPAFPNNASLLSTARTAVNRIYTLALLEQLGGDPAYAQRARAEIAAIAEFPQWSRTNPPKLADDFLSIAEMTHAMAIGYDWLYHTMSEDERADARDAIIDKGLQTALNAYREDSIYTSSPNNVGIVTNAGFGVGALAIAPESPSIAREVLRKSLHSIRPAVEQLSPDGSSPEGGYWGYVIRYLSIYLAALESSDVRDRGLSHVVGLSETGNYAIYLTGPSGQFFNYSDSDPTSQQPPELLWLSERYSKPVYTWWGSRSRSTSTLYLPRYLLWYDPSKDVGPLESELPLDIHFASVEVATFRSAWEDPNALFAGFKAGDNASSHGDLDEGTFVIDANGRRWATELGKDNYGLSGYFDYDGGRRWNYYRKRAEGQNTLVINPSSAPDQLPDASCTIPRYESSASGGYAIADLTSAVPGDAVTSWKRGLAMVDQRQRILVQDEVSPNGHVAAWWFMHTTAQVAISEDGRSAWLTMEDEDGGNPANLLVQMLSAPPGSVFTLRDAAPLPTSPHPQGQSPNTGVSKLAIEVSADEAFRLAVLFTPITAPVDQDLPIPSVIALQDWSTDM